MRKTS